MNQINIQNTSVSRENNLFGANDLSAVEAELKKLWSLYINCIENNASGEKANALKEKYFSLYRSYRKDKKWRELVDGLDREDHL